MSGDLEARVKLIEDKLAVYQLLSAFAPVIDGGGEEEAAEFYAEDGAYIMDVPGASSAMGRPAVLDIYRSDMHRGAVRQGISHMLGFPHVWLDGDRAEAVTYACILRKGEQGWGLARIAANKFKLRRDGSGWRIETRESRELTNEQARAVFGTANYDLAWRE